jgi:hypothetical protein
MTNSISEFTLNLWMTGRQIKTSLSGWISGNAVCCQHRGHSPDTKGRGGFITNSSGTISWSCFNCEFKANYTPGRPLNYKFQQLLCWLGANDDDIKKMSFLAFQISQTGDIANNIVNDQPTKDKWQQFPTISLPQGSRPLESFLADNNVPSDLLVVAEYLASRGEAISSGYDYFWCPSNKNLMNKRLIVPFYFNTQIVGWTARYAGNPPPGVPKYYNSQLPLGYLFNNNIVNILDRKFLILVEGPFDAIAIQGIAALGSKLNEYQIHWLLNQNKQIIVLPDRQLKNQNLIDTALSFGWYVSFPDWEPHIKDAADACISYGQIYTITSALASRTNNPIEIGLKRKMFQG